MSCDRACIPFKASTQSRESETVRAAALDAIEAGNFQTLEGPALPLVWKALTRNGKSSMKPIAKFS